MSQRIEAGNVLAGAMITSAGIYIEVEGTRNIQHSNYLTQNAHVLQESSDTQRYNEIMSQAQQEKQTGQIDGLILGPVLLLAGISLIAREAVRSLRK